VSSAGQDERFPFAAAADHHAGRLAGAAPRRYAFEIGGVV